VFTVTVVDETTAGIRGEAWHLEIFEETTTLRELIRRRVFQEVAEFNARQGPVFQGLVPPADAEATLNGYRLRQPRRVDPETQAELALAAFGRNGFVVLVDDRQVEELDAALALTRGSQVTFLKLVPLVGG
jgi:anti-sigma factor RsiW